MFLKLGFSDLGKILISFTYVLWGITTFNLTVLIFTIQFLIVSNKFFDAIFELNNNIEKISYYFKFVETSEPKIKKIYIDKLNSIEFKNVYFHYSLSLIHI